jgi:uncharacterized RDD family membrane protein YckC
MSETMWYYRIGNKKVGPLPQSQLQKLFDDQILAPETLIWSDALLDWIPAEMADAFQTNIKKTSEETSNIGIQQIRPWVRYWARMLDINLFAMFFWTAMSYYPYDISDISTTLIPMVMLFSWVFVESVLLFTIGTTPGKWLLKIKLTNADGKKISFPNAMQRSFLVWWRGLGTGFPIASLWTLITAETNLKKNGITSWDREGNFIVTHERIGALRTIIVIFFFILSFIIAYWGYYGNSTFESRQVTKNNNKNDLTEYYLKGAVKSVRFISYKLVESGGKLINGECTGENYATFNPQGNIIEMGYYIFRDGKIFSENITKYIYKYDYKGVKTCEKYNSGSAGKGLKWFSKAITKYDSKNNVSEMIDSGAGGWGHSLYKYDEKGNLILTNYSNASGDSTNCIYEYDSNGNRISETKNFLKDGGGQKSIYRYTNNYKEVEVKIYDRNGNTSVRSIKKSNSNNEIVSYEYFHIDEGIHRKYKYVVDEYDQNKNWLRQIEYENEKPVSIAEREIEYY